MTAAGDGQEHDVRAALERQDRRDPRRVEDPGEAREQVREHEVADLDLADVDAALARAEHVAAGRDRAQAPARAAEDELHRITSPTRPVELGVEEVRDVAAGDEPEVRAAPPGVSYLEPARAGAG